MTDTVTSIKKINMYYVLLKICRTYLEKNDPLEIQDTKFENSRLGLFESVHDI